MSCRLLDAGERLYVLQKVRWGVPLSAHLTEKECRGSMIW